MRQGPSLKMTRPPRPERQGEADAVKPFARLILMRLLLGRSPASTTLAAATARTCGPAAAATCTACTAGSTAGRRGLRDGGLRPEYLNERLVGALLVGISAADADRADHLIVHHDGQTTADEVVRQALLFAKIQANQTAVNVFEA
jgi:hypothetical protein